MKELEFKSDASVKAANLSDKKAIKIQGDGHCLFNTVLVAYVDAYGTYPIDKYGNELKTQDQLRSLIANHYLDNFLYIKEFLKHMLIDTIKVENFAGLHVLGLQEIKTAYIEGQQSLDDYLNASINDTKIQEYITNIGNGNIWGGGQELSVLSRLLKIKIKLSGQPNPYNDSEDPAAREVEIQYVGNNHYNVLISILGNQELQSLMLSIEADEAKDDVPIIPAELAMMLETLDNDNFLLAIQIIFNKREAEGIKEHTAIAKKEIEYAIDFLKLERILKIKSAVGAKAFSFDVYHVEDRTHNEVEDDITDVIPNAFRWQVEVQFKRLKDALLRISKERIREISRFIGKELTKLNKDGGYVHGIRQTLIEMIKDKMEEHIKNSVINDSQYREYLAKMAEVEGERREEREKLKEEELSGYDGLDRAIMERELDSEVSEEEDGSNFHTSDSSSNEGDSEEEDRDSSIFKYSVEDEDNDGKKDATVEVSRHYSDNMRGRLEKYIDDEADPMVSDLDGVEDYRDWFEGNEVAKAEAEGYREWATEILDSFGDLEDVQNLLDNFFSDEEGYSWFIHDLMMSSLYFDADLLDEMVFVDGGITREEVEIVLAVVDLFIDWGEYELLDQYFIVKTLSSTFKKFESGKGGDIEKVLEDLQERLLYYDDEEVSPECRKVENKFNNAFARDDYVEAQRVWSIYTAYRRHLHDNQAMDEDGDDAVSYAGSTASKKLLTIKKRLNDALDRAELYEMRLYPHSALKKLVYKDADGVAEFNLGRLMGELEAVGKAIEPYRPTEKKAKRKNIFVPAFVFVVSTELEDGSVKREFITVKLNLNYPVRLLSKKPTDGVLTAAEDLTAIARQDIISGYKVFATEADGIKAADAVTKGAAININTNINHSERVLVQALRKQANVIKTVQLLREEVIKKFCAEYSDSYVVDAVALVGYSTNTVCDNCSPTLIYLQNSREEGGPLNLLAKELNKQVAGQIKFTARGYSVETGKQDFSQFRMQTFVSAQVNFASQAHDMTDHHCGTKQPNPPKKTYNPKAKLILPNDAFGLHIAVKLEDDSCTLGQPYIVEFSGVDHSADYVHTGQLFPGVCFTSGGDSWYGRIKKKAILAPIDVAVYRVEIRYDNKLLNMDEGVRLLNTAQYIYGTEAVNLLLDLGKDPNIAEQILSAVNEQGDTIVLNTLMGFAEQYSSPKKVINADLRSETFLITNSGYDSSAQPSQNQGSSVFMFIHGLADKIASALNYGLMNVGDVIMQNSYIKHQLINYVYHEELSAINTVINKPYIQSSTNPAVQLLLEKHPLQWSKKDFKQIKLVVHPDKGGKAEDFRTVNAFEEQIVDKDQMYRNILPKLLPNIQTLIHKNNIRFKVLDIAVDSGRLIYEPTLVNAKKVVLDSTYLYSIYYGVNSYSSIISAIHLLQLVYQEEYTQALKQAATTIAYMALPKLLSYTAIPHLGIAYGIGMAGYTGYSAITNAYSFYLERTSDVESILRSIIAYRDLAKTFSESPLQQLYDFTKITKGYEVELNNITLAAEKKALKSKLVEEKGEFGQKLYDHIYESLLEEKYNLLNQVLQGNITQEEAEILKAKHIKIESDNASYEHCMEIRKIDNDADTNSEHYYCYNDEKKQLDYVLIGDNLFEVVEHL